MFLCIFLFVLTSLRYTKNAQLLQKLLKSKSTGPLEQASGRELPEPSSNLASSSMARSSTRPAAGLVEVDGNNQNADEDRLQSSARVMLAWERDNKERDKENLRSHDNVNTAQVNAASSQRQPDITGSTYEPGGSSRKRPRDPIDDESDVSEDAGFQSDSRVPNPNKRVKLSANRPVRDDGVSNDELSRQSDSTLNGDRDEIARQNRANLELALQANAHEDDERGNLPADYEDINEQNTEEDIPPDSTQARAAAKVATAKVKAMKPPPVQTRKPWSPADEAHLIDLIENYGTSWAILLEHSNFEREETQVGLKDKARNLKVAYLK